jgi:hypothetical protein
MTSPRQFQFRLQSEHQPPERTSNNLRVQWLNPQGSWEPQQLSLTMPGFRLYLISLLLCQHHYLVANALERELPLQRVEAEFEVTAADNWIIQGVSGRFRVTLSGNGANLTTQVSESDLNYIKERMQACPVSRNLPPGVAKLTSVDLS